MEYKKETPLFREIEKHIHSKFKQSPKTRLFIAIKNKIFTAPIGSSAEGASFKDIFREEDLKEDGSKPSDNEELFSLLHGVKNMGNRYNFCYLCYMAIRLIDLRRILKSTGSLYLHCDSTMSHYLKIVLDCIFARRKF